MGGCVGGWFCQSKLFSKMMETMGGTDNHWGNTQGGWDGQPGEGTDNQGGDRHKEGWTHRAREGGRTTIGDGLTKELQSIHFIFPAI